VTLLPLDVDKDAVRGVAGPKYKVGPRCCNPTCGRFAEHAHHIWPRSYLRKQPKDWIELPDGRVFANMTAVCPECHDDLSGPIGGYRAAIRLGINDDRFWWCKTAGRNGATIFEPVDPIVPQPPTREALVASPADVESDSCPTCGQPRRRRSPKPASGERRRRKSWTIKVPDDHEDGALVLDTLIDDLAPFLEIEHVDAASRYFVVVPALYFAQTKRDEFVNSILGVG
jgi:hypothetical protein